MADAIPTPIDQEPKVKSTVIIPAPMSRWEALKAAGWWAKLDTTFCVLIALTWVTALYWKIFGNPSGLDLIALLLLNLNLLVVWLVVLSLRCALFVLQLNADIATLPEASARIAVAFLAGQSPPQIKK